MVSPSQVALQLVGRALDDDAAAVDDREPRGEPVGLLQVVRREQDRHQLLARQALDLVPHLRARLGVEAGRRLVEEQHLRAVQQADRDVEPALHAARVRLRPGGRPRRPGRSARATRVTRCLRSRPGDAVELALEHEVLAPGRLRIARRASARRRRSRGARAPGRRARRCPATRALPLSGRDSVVRILTVVDLPAPFGPSRPKMVPGRDGEAQPVERRDRGRVGLPQFVCLDCELHLVLLSR